MLKTLGLYRRGVGLHALRHSYVSMLAMLTDGDVAYIAKQVGHSSTQLTNDVYRHVLAKTRVETMRRLNQAIPTQPESTE
jgi:integrase